MEESFWYLFGQKRGGVNRARIVYTLSEQPQNTNELADNLNISYSTACHHLEKLENHNIVKQHDGDYANLYFLTDRFERHREAFEQVIAQVDLLESEPASVLQE